MWKMVGLLIVAACMLVGCNSGTFNVAYPDAVAALTEFYPAVDPATEYSENLAFSHPAYSNEMGGSPWGFSAGHEEIIPGKEYRIVIEKSWKFSPRRRTTWIIERQGDASVQVTVESAREVAMETFVRDSNYEAVRMAEVREMLTPLETATGK